jgi:amino acid transporter
MAVTSSAGRPKSGRLGTWDLTVSTVATIGPGIDFYFAFGVIAVTAGVAAPLTIIAAGIAVMLFDGGRSGLLPARLGGLRRSGKGSIIKVLLRTPAAALA